MIQVLVNGAAGRMGSEVVRTVAAEEGLIVCGAVDPGAAGKDLGEVVGTGHNGITISPSLEEAFAKGKPDVVVDFIIEVLTEQIVVSGDDNTTCSELLEITLVCSLTLSDFTPHPHKGTKKALLKTIDL